MSTAMAPETFMIAVLVGLAWEAGLAAERTCA